MKPPYIIIVFLLLFSSAAYAFPFNPRLTIISSYSTTENFMEINSGKFGLENRKINFGFELTHDIRLGRNYYIRSGIQYKTYRKTAHGFNQVPETYDTPYPFNWQHAFLSLTVPVYFIKRWDSPRQIEVYGGGTLGITALNEARLLVAGREHRDPSLPLLVERTMIDTTTLQQSPRFMATVNIGASFCPFKSIPRFTVGAQVAAQLFKNSYSYYYAFTEIPSRQEMQRYSASHEMRMIDYSLMLTYIFGKKGRKTVSANNLNCPTFNLKN